MTLKILSCSCGFFAGYKNCIDGSVCGVPMFVSQYLLCFSIWPCFKCRSAEEYIIIFETFWIVYRHCLQFTSLCISRDSGFLLEIRHRRSASNNDAVSLTASFPESSFTAVTRPWSIFSPSILWLYHGHIVNETSCWLFGYVITAFPLFV